MARGRSWNLYVDDLGALWAVLVDVDYAADPDRGWTAVDPTVVAQLPRGWLPRKVVGLDSLGNQILAIAATTAAPIWSGAVATFSFFATDQLAHDATIIGRRSERRLPRTSSAG
jgi:hypothetical protein